MEGDEIALIAVFGGILLIILLFFLSIPVKGSVMGFEITAPIIGWIGIAAIAILALVVSLKAFFSK